MAENEELPAGAGQDAIDELHGIRQSIDNIDAALIHMLAERFKFTQQVGRLKAKHGLPAADPARELQQIQRLRALAEEARLDPGFAEKFLNFIVAEVIHHHVRLAGGQAATGDEQAPGAAIEVEPDSAVGAPAPATGVIADSAIGAPAAPAATAPAPATTAATAPVPAASAPAASAAAAPAPAAPASDPAS